MLYSRDTQPKLNRAATILPFVFPHILSLRRWSIHLAKSAPAPLMRSSAPLCHYLRQFIFLRVSSLLRPRLSSNMSTSSVGGLAQSLQFPRAANEQKRESLDARAFRRRRPASVAGALYPDVCIEDLVHSPVERKHAGCSCRMTALTVMKSLWPTTLSLWCSLSGDQAWRLRSMYSREKGSSDPSADA